MKIFFITCTSAFFLLSSFAPALHAAEKYTSVSITPEKTHVSAGETINIATTINLQPHWHVYWLNPGDSGLPVEINWSVPKDFEFSKINWATPDKIIFDILANYGYYDQVTLLQTLKIPQNLPEEKITLSADVRMLVCNEICVPETQTVTLTLNDPEISPADHTDVIRAAERLLPAPSIADSNFSGDDNDFILHFKTDNPDILKAAQNNTLEFFPADYGLITYVNEAKTSVENNNVTLRHKRGDQPLSNFKTAEGVLVIQDGLKSTAGFALTAQNTNQSAASPESVQNQPAHTPMSADNIKTELSYLHALIFSFIGGLILNLMPCVFPVLSIKALSLIKMKDKEKSHARLNGLSYTAGVILSFTLIGGLLLIFKSSGSSIGWGFQLQNPIVIAVLAYLLLIIGLNLMGVFEVSNRFGGSLGQSLTKGNGITGAFFTGVLATFVATPCTAPFMGAAMGYAVLQSAPVAISIFAVLGLGLAFPYAFLCFVPAAQKILPRPGEWMNIFKQFLAFPMFAAAIWMIWILDQQSGATAVLSVLTGMLAIIFALWSSRFKPKGFIGNLNTLMFVLCLLIPLYSLTNLSDAQKYSTPYSESALSEALKSDDPVFVEMTAAWCITCKFNHAAAINVQSTKNLFKEKNIRYLIGDWTNYNQEITDYLESFGRNGVPIYVYYGKKDKNTGKRPDPVLLPQVLTPGIVENTINN